MTRTAGFLVMFAAGLMLCSVGIAEEEASETYVVRIYDVTALTVPHGEFPFDGGIPGTPTKHVSPFTSGGGGGFGAGGLGGGSFDASPPAGGGGFFSVGSAGVSQAISGTMDFDQSADGVTGRLVELLVTVVEPSSWDGSGCGSGSGQCHAFGTRLVIRQTESIHQEIRTVLDGFIQAATNQGPPLQLRAWWLPVDADRHEQLQELLTQDSTNVGTLDAWCSEVEGFRAELLCQRNRASHTTSGVRQSFVETVIPVVGTGASSNTTMVGAVNFGFALEVTPTQIDQQTNNSESPSDGPQPYNLHLKSSLTFPEDDGIQPRDEDWEIDRVTTGAYVVETNCRLRPGVPTVAGRLSIPPNQSWLRSKEAPLDLVHVVLLTEADN